MRCDRAARCREFARIERSSSNCQRAFEWARTLAGELLHAGKTVPRAVAQSKVGVAFRDIWVRIDRPRSFQDFSCLARLAGLGQPSACPGPRRPETRCELDRFEHQFS